MIVDAHCHVWPDHIAPEVLASRPAGLEGMHDGTVAGLLKTMDGAGVDRALCLAVATTGRTVARTNEFIGTVDRSRLVPFGTIHTDLSAEQNLASLRGNGITGVKIHPLFQRISLADPRLINIARALAENGFAVIAHVGAGADTEANERSAPRHARNLIDQVPELTLITCHFGGYHRLDEASACLIGSGAWLETSWPPRLAGLDPGIIRRIISAHGADRMVFGSDWPMADPAAEMAAIRSLGLSPEAEYAILGGNLARLLGIS